MDETALALMAAGAVKLGASIYMNRKKNELFEQVGTVSELFIYPVKSCKGISLSEARCGPTGIQHNGAIDRSDHFLCIQLLFNVDICTAKLLCQ